MTEDVPRDATLPAGYDEEDPYEDVDVDTLPEWWRQNVEEFEQYGMRPYRPPKFADDGTVPDIVTEIEADLNAEIRIACIDPRAGNDWSVLVDGEQVASIAVEREGEGFTRFDITSSDFRRIVYDNYDTL